MRFHIMCEHELCNEDQSGETEEGGYAAALLGCGLVVPLNPCMGCGCGLARHCTVRTRGVHPERKQGTLPDLPPKPPNPVRCLEGGRAGVRPPLPCPLSTTRQYPASVLFPAVTEMEGFNSHLNIEQMNKVDGAACLLGVRERRAAQLRGRGAAHVLPVACSVPRAGAGHAGHSARRPHPCHSVQALISLSDMYEKQAARGKTSAFGEGMPCRQTAVRGFSTCRAGGGSMRRARRGLSWDVLAVRAMPAAGHGA